MLYRATYGDIWFQLYKGLFALLALRILAGPVVAAANALEIVITHAIIDAHLAVYDL